MILAIFYASLLSFKSIGLSFLEKKQKVEFQGYCFGIPIEAILAAFDLTFTTMLPIKFRVNWPSVQEKKRKIDFQDGHNGSHLRFPIGFILATFDL